MDEKRIPKETWFRVTRKGIEKFKMSKYQLLPAEKIKAKQEKLGKMVDCYYGTNCEKCCGVYPAFFTESTFDALCYYVCLVCGKECKHESMTWQAVNSWNEHKYIYNPESEETQCQNRM